MCRIRIWEIWIKVKKIRAADILLVQECSEKCLQNQTTRIPYYVESLAKNVCFWSNSEVPKKALHEPAFVGEGENSAYFEESQAELDISIEKPCNKNHNLMTYSLN